MKKIFSVSILILLLFNFIVSFLVFESNILQSSLISEFNSNQFKESTLEKSLISNISFPNISVTGLPLKDMVANQLLVVGRFDESLDYLNLKVNDNPFLGLNEVLKSRIFFEYKQKDSALLYAKKASSLIPNNIIHFERLLVTLAIDKSIDDIFSAYSNIEFPDTNFIDILLSTLVAMDFDEMSTDQTSQILKIKSDYIDNQKFQDLTDILLVGRDVLSDVSKLNKQASDLYQNGLYEQAASLYLKAKTLNPYDYAIYENAGLCMLLSKNYDGAINMFNTVIDSLNKTSPKSLYLRGMSLIEVGQKEAACLDFIESSKFNYKEARTAYYKFCK